VAICDNYAKAFRRAVKDTPAARQYDHYTKLLADPKVQAVIIATPTGTHKEIALAALAAGKHVYCEAPLANTIDDAREIAKAGRDAVKVVFQPGLQQRSHPQLEFILPFIRSGGLGRNVMVRAQWHANDTWHRTAPDDREEALNWRLRHATSTGLFGEEGIHQIDTVCRFLGARPQAVTGFSSTIRAYDDRRDVPDTVQAVFEFPHGVNFSHDLTICNSYEQAGEVYLGADAALLVRDFKTWLFKEPKAPLMGWEVYARREKLYNQTGLVLEPSYPFEPTTLADGSPAHTPLYYALDAFADRAGRLTVEVSNRAQVYPDEDTESLAEYLLTVPSLKVKPAANWRDGLDATVMAIAANQAALKKQKITLEKEWFEL
jgi:predicted dehydrogenase